MHFSKRPSLILVVGLFTACGNPDEQTGDPPDGSSSSNASSSASASTTIDETTGPKISYAKDIEPIFITNCAICHFDGGTAVNTAESDLDLTEGAGYAALTTQSSVVTGTKFVADTLDESYLWKKMNGTKPPAGTTMPFGTVLLGSDLQLVQQWIAGGAAP